MTHAASKWIAAGVFAALLVAVPAANAADAPKTWDGLTEVKSPKMDVAYLMAGTDFRSYTKVMLDQPEVAFQKNWMRDMNSDINRRVTPKDAERILAAVQTDTSEIFEKAFTKAGYTVVTEAGADVLRIRSAVTDIYVNAPDTMSSGFGRTFTANAGEATLVLELRDGLTNALLGRVLDRRETQGSPGQSTRFTNEAEYRDLASLWAKTSVKGLEALKAVSPVPDPLTPGQKLN